MPLNSLEERLKAAASGIQTPFVYLRADRAVPYGDVMAVMDRIKRSGIERVGLVTEPIPAGAAAQDRRRKR